MKRVPSLVPTIKKGKNKVKKCAFFMPQALGKKEEGWNTRLKNAYYGLHKSSGVCDAFHDKFTSPFEAIENYKR
jgi:hypothetical protein